MTKPANATMLVIASHQVAKNGVFNLILVSTTMNVVWFNNMDCVYYKAVSEITLYIEVGRSAIYRSQITVA